MSEPDDDPDTPPLLCCTMCQSPRLEYQATVHIERRVLGMQRFPKIDRADILVIDEEDEEPNFQNERFFCLNCHHTMPLKEAVEAYEGRSELILDFLSSDEFASLHKQTTNAVESTKHDEDHQDDS